MAANTFGDFLKVTTFGESHGAFIGAVIDNFPSGVIIDYQIIENWLDKRRPSKSFFETNRIEKDVFSIISGLFNNKTTGAPITILIENNLYNSAEYNNIKNLFRPSHCDFTYHNKYHNYDSIGGGRASARETAARVAAGAIIAQIPEMRNLMINAFVSQIGEIIIPQPTDYKLLENAYSNIFRTHTASFDNEINNYLLNIVKNEDTVGGVVSCIIQNLPIGIGEPIFDKLQADIAKAMMSISAAKGFEYGLGFKAAKMLGSQHNDTFEIKNNVVKPKTNNAGGILAGISTGEPINFNVAFKPISSIGKTQETISKDNKKTTFKINGRHDVCIASRAVPIVEAMTYFVLADKMLIAGNIKRKNI